MRVKGWGSLNESFVVGRAAGAAIDPANAVLPATSRLTNANLSRSSLTLGPTPLEEPAAAARPLALGPACWNWRTSRSVALGFWRPPSASDGRTATAGTSWAVQAGETSKQALHDGCRAILMSCAAFRQPTRGKERVRCAREGILVRHCQPDEGRRTDAAEAALVIVAAVGRDVWVAFDAEHGPGAGRAVVSLERAGVAAVAEKGVGPGRIAPEAVSSFEYEEQRRRIRTRTRADPSLGSGRLSCPHLRPGQRTSGTRRTAPTQASASRGRSRRPSSARHSTGRSSPCGKGRAVSQRRRRRSLPSLMVGGEQHAAARAATGSARERGSFSQTAGSASSTTSCASSVRYSAAACSI